MDEKVVKPQSGSSFSLAGNELWEPPQELSENNLHDFDFGTLTDCAIFRGW